MADVQEIYAILLARQYQEELFQDLPGKRKREKGGQETLVDCPFCGKPDKFSYSSREPLWKCWRCEEAGDWLRYLEKAKGLDFREALHFLAQAAGVEVAGADSRQYQAYTKRASILEEAQAIFVQELSLKREGEPSPEAAAIMEYLLSRGYSGPEWEAMELGAYTDRETLQRELKAKGYSRQELKDSGLLSPKSLGDTHQLTLLWRDSAGRAIGIAARSILPGQELESRGLPKYFYSAGLKKSEGLVGLASARGAEELILVEGPLDALRLQSLGLKAVALGGTSLSAAQVRALQANRTKGILLALDRDEAGQQATEKALQTLRLSELKSYVVSLPEGYKDPDELVRDKGLEAFQDCLARAEAWPRWMGRRIASRQDLSTDRGLDRALDEFLELYSSLEDGQERRRLLDALRDSTGLTEEELSGKLAKTALRASQRASERVLEATLAQVQQRAAQGDILGAEADLEAGLQELRTARGVQVPEPYLVEDLIADIHATRDGLQTGYSSLDSILKIPQGALTIVAGRPGQGKTTLLLNLLLNQLRAYPERAFYFFSYEEARKFLALKLIIMAGGHVFQAQEFNLEAHLNYFQEKRGTEPAIEKAIKQYQEWTEAGRLLISDSMPSGEDLAATIGWLARRGPVGAIFVDYIQKIPLRQPLQQRYLEIKRVSELLLQQAVQQDVPIVLGAQLGRKVGAVSKVTLDNLRESGDIEQDANLVLGLYNKAAEEMEETGQAIQAREVELWVSVLKQRGGVAGRSKPLSFDRPALRIKDRQRVDVDERY